MGEKDFLGEIVINYSQIKKQAKKYSNTIAQELIFILVHGLLHLIGYQDHTEKGIKEMEKLTYSFINNINILTKN
jgi:probable rRNA maturation factor